MTGQSTSLTPQEMAVETTQQQDEGDTVMEKSDDNVESSSTGSDGGKGGGSGSGGGYSADNSTDCSSSDASSLEAAKGNAPDKEMTRLNLNGDSTKDKPTKTKETKPNKNLKSSTPKSQKTCRRSSEQAETSHSGSVNHEESSLDSGTKWKNLKDTVEETSSFPQWNGVRIHHPMDPRIDLSTVGHIQTSSLSAFPSNVDIPTNQNAEPQTSHQADTPGECSEPPPPPSIDQYMKLMEVINYFRRTLSFTR